MKLEIELSDGIYDELERLAEEDNDTVEGIIQQAIRVYLRFREGAYNSRHVEYLKSQGIDVIL